MEPWLEELWKELLEDQEQIRVAAQEVHEYCPVDARYQADWEYLRDYVDTHVSNVQSALALKPGESEYSDKILGEYIASAIITITATANALLEGYLYDLALCTDQEGNSCPLSQRARMILALRDPQQSSLPTQESV